MLDNMLEMVNDEDKFDFLSKVLLDMAEVVFQGRTPEEVIKRIVKSGGNIVLGKLLVKAMRDTETL